MKIGNINVNGGNVQITAGTITIDNKDVNLKKAMKILASLGLTIDSLTNKGKDDFFRNVKR